MDYPSRRAPAGGPRSTRAVGLRGFPALGELQPEPDTADLQRRGRKIKKWE